MQFNKSIFLSVFIGSVLLPATSDASTRRHDRTDSLYQALGNGFTSVGSLTIGGTQGSATLIGSHWILTSAKVRNAGGASTGTFVLNGSTYTVTNLINHPAFNMGSMAHDFALGYISDTVMTTPAAYYTGDDEVGRIATSVGFGSFGTGLTGGVNTDNKRRGFTNFIDAKNLSLLPGLVADFDDGTEGNNALGQLGSSPNKSALEGALTAGDYGGGLFMDHQGQQVLIGVSSYDFGSGTPATYGHLSGWADVTAGALWIYQTTGIAPVNGAPVPEPATMAVLAVGALAALRRRRG